MTSRTCTRTSTSPKRSWRLSEGKWPRGRSDTGRLIRATALACLLVVGLGSPAPGVGCEDEVYRVTVVDPTGVPRGTRVCALGELASWLHLTPETSITSSPPEPDLGPLYVVRFEILEGSGARRLIQLRLYPRAPDAPVVFLGEPGYVESQTYTGSVPLGWRLLDPGVRVPATLTSIGVPQVVGAPTPEPQAPASRLRSGPDAISVAFLAGLAGMLAVAFARRARRTARR